MLILDGLVDWGEGLDRDAVFQIHRHDFYDTLVLGHHCTCHGGKEDETG
ncbi:hypothetical protein [Mesorhizobium sp.]|nr:hypothetical protein [Mesorhizobium sp.]